MTATFVVEDGTGLTDSNSYLSVVDSIQYHENHAAPATWTALSSSDKEKHIRIATQYIDAVYGPRLKGVRKTDSQALLFPRYGVYSEDGYCYSTTEVPQAVKDATAELALRSLTESLIVDQTDASLVVKDIKVGPIEIKKEYSGGSLSQKKYSIADALMQDLLEGGYRIYRA